MTTYSRKIFLLLAVAAATACSSPQQTYTSSYGQAPQPEAPPPADNRSAVPTTLVGVGGVALEQLTHTAGSEVTPAVSDDSTKLAYAYYEPEIVNGVATGNFAVMQVIGSPVNAMQARTNYTAARFMARSPEWLPGDSGLLFATDAMGQWNVVRSLSSAPGGAMSVVADGQAAPNARELSAQPGGDRVAFQTELREVTTIATVKLDGSGFTVLTEGYQPRYSPDGKLLVFNRKVNGTFQLFSIDAATGSNLVQITNDQNNSTGAHWSPDGNRLVFMSDRGWDRYPEARLRSVNLYVINRDGTGLTQLTDGPFLTESPFWAADGAIYFASNAAGNFDLYRIAAQGSESSN